MIAALLFVILSKAKDPFRRTELYFNCTSFSTSPE